MEEIKKRGKGKIKGCLGIRQMYDYYKKNYDEPVEYKLFTKIIKASNKELINQIVNHSTIFKMPYRLGTMQISKFKRSLTQPQNKWKVDYKRTREMGFVVYHDSPFIYKWVWKKHYAIVRNKTGYKFKANRSAARGVAKALKQRVDYFK